MFAYQHEAAKTCSANSWLSPGASRSSGYGRGHHGVVGIGAGDQKLVAAGPQVSNGVSEPRLPRKANRSRWTCLLPPEPVAGATQGQFTEINGGTQR